MGERVPTGSGCRRDEEVQEMTYIRWQIRRDMPFVLSIEEKSFADPWDEDSVCSLLRRSNYIGMVAEREDATIGYMIYELKKRSLVLHRIAVDPAFRNEGVGSAMVQKLINKLSVDRRRVISITIPDTLLQAHMFFSKLGFIASGNIVELNEQSEGINEAYEFRYMIRIKEEIDGR